jgi:hypothetical protein
MKSNDKDVPVDEMRYVARRASECPTDAIVIPFPEEYEAADLAAKLNAGHKEYGWDGWAMGAACKYIYEDGESWCVLDTRQAMTSEGGES